MTRLLWTRTLVAVALLGACVGCFVPVAEAGGPAPALYLPASIEAGTVGTLTVQMGSAVGCFADEVPTVELTIKPVGGTATPWLTIPKTSLNSNGRATVAFTTPESPGDYVVRAFDGVCEAVGAMDVYPSIAAPTTVTPTTVAPTTTTPAAAAPTTANTALNLPATGWASSGPVWMASVILLLGGGILSLTARRR